MADGEGVVFEKPGINKAGSAETGKELCPVKVEKCLDSPKYEVRPGLSQRFQYKNVKKIILTTMHEQLMGKEYRADKAQRWAKVIANSIRQRVQDLDMKRYKILVQTTVLEMTGAGFKCGQRCIWDPETDHYANELYRSNNIFCHTVVYGVYMY